MSEDLYPYDNFIEDYDKLKSQEKSWDAENETEEITTIEDIHESLVNGQFKQFRNQVNFYNIDIDTKCIINLDCEGFWKDYCDYLEEIFLPGFAYKWLKSAILHSEG